jgi:hypothetical protein
MKTRNQNNHKNQKDILFQIELLRTLGPIYALHFPAARSRVGIRLAANRKAKPNANTRTLRPDKCLVVKPLDSSLRPVRPRNMESTAITTRALKTRRVGRI